MNHAEANSGLIRHLSTLPISQVAKTFGVTSATWLRCKMCASGVSSSLLKKNPYTRSSTTLECMRIGSGVKSRPMVDPCYGIKAQCLMLSSYDL